MNKAKYFGLLGIPLATLGIVGSVAFAETSAQQIVAPTLRGAAQGFRSRRPDRSP